MLNNENSNIKNLSGINNFQAAAATYTSLFNNKTLKAIDFKNAAT